MGNVVTTNIEAIDSSSTVTSINNNIQKLRDEFDKVVYKDGREELTGNLDANSKRIINLPDASTNSEPITLGQLAAASSVPDIAAEALLRIAGDSARPTAVTLATDAGAGGIGFKQTGANSVLTTLDAKAKEMSTAKDKGALTGNTNANNKIALQKLITDLSTAGVGVGVSNPDFDYGYKNTDITTYPDFSLATGDFVLYDYSIGDADGAGNKAGAQVRVWMHTQQTAPTPGIHDGNTWWHRAAWHPAHIISNDMDLTGARAASDNRRASYYTAVNGHVTYRFGQCALQSATATDEELSNFVIEQIAMPGDTLGTYNPLIIERKTGNWAVATDTNSPTVSYDFASKTTGFDQVRWTNPFGVRSRLIMRNNQGAGSDIVLDNNSGSLELGTVAGTAVTINKTSRKVTYTWSVVEHRRVYADGATVTFDAELGNWHTVAMTTGAAFIIEAPINPSDGQRITITIKNTSGGALGAATWNSVFKMASWTNPAIGFERSIDFRFDGVNWRQIGTTVDVPN